eukprot:CAMPEP_0183414856 /NCGR_PEP_ID=MMETSP0370-20130417/22692_1 /TAXON_ID=268820 /ORGANISM="Peridinium aciculiferum, Strain PAER-2" /LENGTH=47 /DNA_ID= /DNA_START= /DNA_END= /DNA_ORIENTATION=
MATCWSSTLIRVDSACETETAAHRAWQKEDQENHGPVAPTGLARDPS